ncbi:MAG TPA: DUF416 family protein [Emticicia sp.]
MDIFLDTIDQKLKKLSFKHRVLFTLLTCEKLLPNYTVFSEREQWGNAKLLEDSVLNLFQYLQDFNLSKSQLKSIYKEIELITPDTEDFESGLTSYALDTCVAILETIEHLLDQNIENALNVASCARDTVDMFIYELENLDSEDKQLEEKIAENEYMVREARRQDIILNKLLNEEFKLQLITSTRELNNKSEAVINLSLIY